jgi:hypothetical protein
VTPARKRAREPALAGFYADAVRNAEALVEAAELEGVEHEIAVLRTALHDMLAERPVDYALMLRGAEILVRCVAAKYRMSPQSAHDLAEALGETIQRLGGQIFPERVGEV